MAKNWGKLETRITVSGGDYPEVILEFAELPQRGDKIAIHDFGIFEVIERGFSACYKNEPPRFLILSEIEGSMTAPPSGRYDFLKDN